jgi:hypothetical protein
MSKTSYKYYVAPVYDLNFSNKTVLTAGISHEVSASLSNATKLSLGTAITAGLSTSLKFGQDIEFKHSRATKAEIDIDDEAIKDTRTGTTNIYNADQFRVTAGELAPEPLNTIKAALITNGRWLAFAALLCQLAATSLTISTALKANLDASDDHPDVPFWGGGGGQGTGATYWASWSTVLIEGFSLVSLVLAFLAGREIDSSKRKSPTRHQNFLNMDKNTGIMLGVLSPSLNPGFGSGSWYSQKNNSVEIGCYDDMKFNEALTIREFNLPAPLNKVPGRLSVSQDGVQLEGGKNGIENLVPAGRFIVKVANETRVLLTKDNSFVGRPGANFFGLNMQSNRVQLSVDQNSDLNLGADMVKLRIGANTSLALKTNEATLSAQAIKLAAPSVNIVGAEFKPGQAKIGDLVCLITDVSALQTQAQEAADNMKRITESLANEAKAKAKEAADALELAAQKAKAELLNQASELQSQVAFVKGEVARLNAMSKAP